MKLLVLSLALLVVFAASEKARYDKYRMYEIFVENQEQLELMEMIEEYPDGVSCFKRSVLCFESLFGIFIL